jgi:FkbM family methyltransferase
MLTRENYIQSQPEIQPELLHFFDRTDSLIIFDIGACEAEDSIRYSNLFPNSSIYAFEPRQDNCKRADDLIKEYNKSNIVLENIALSKENGNAKFYLSEGEPQHLKNDENWNYGNKSSSLLPPSKEMRSHIEWLNFNNWIEVKTIKLEDYVEKKKISMIDLAHIDVQGAELIVLQGAGIFLKKIKLIWMEVESVQLYENQPIKRDIELFMNSNNFTNILDTVDTLSGDQLYVNREYFSDDQIKSATLLRRRTPIGLMSKLKSLLKLY